MNRTQTKISWSNDIWKNTVPAFICMFIVCFTIQSKVFFKIKELTQRMNSLTHKQVPYPTESCYAIGKATAK